jgi:hypothetical protein
VDYAFYAWPSAGLNFNETVSAILKASKLPPQNNTVGWYGSMTHHSRASLKIIGDAHFDLFAIFHVPGDIATSRDDLRVSLPAAVHRHAILLDIGRDESAQNLRVVHSFMTYPPAQ